MTDPRGTPTYKGGERSLSLQRGLRGAAYTAGQEPRLQVWKPRSEVCLKGAGWEKSHTNGVT